jgi:prepilin signal peptidase PulO-like enzyme (type II secretory pathway)
MTFDQVHLIIVSLVLFLVGVVILFYLLLPTLIASIRERTLPRILTRLAALLALWIAVYFASLLLAYYRLVTLPEHYSGALAVAAAGIPWLTIYWRFRWREALDREAKKESE